MKKAFTLIEVLVVVLIIGILAAVALPQYQKTVEKTKAVQAWTILKALAQAEQTYYLANGEYAQSFDDLGVDMSAFPGNTMFNTYVPCTTDTRSNGDWSFQIMAKPGCIYATDYPIRRVLAGRISGPYQGAGWAIELDHDNRLLCFVQKGQGVTYDFDRAGQRAYCRDIFTTQSPQILNGVWDAFAFP